MGLFDLFRKKRRAKRKGRGGNQDYGAKPAIQKVQANLNSLQAQVGTINIVLKKHDDQLLEHTELIEEHSEGLVKLEQILNTAPVSPPALANTPSPCPSEMTGAGTTTESTMRESSQKFDVNRFSEQEKRILSVFFQNKDRQMSYADVGRILNKSANTIKNQMRQIRQKADLFDRATGNQSRNLFKLKDGMRIEKYLNIGRSIDRPVSTTWTIQSNNPE